MISDIFTMMQGHGSGAFAEEFAQGIARSAAVAFDEAFGRCGEGMKTGADAAPEMGRARASR